jgi:hypothetical protein
MVKSAVFTPIPRASVRTAIPAKPGEFLNAQSIASILPNLENLARNLVNPFANGPSALCSEECLEEERSLAHIRSAFIDAIPGL